MVHEVFIYALYCGIYLVEMALFVYVLLRGRWKRLTSMAVYVAALLALDGIGRSYFLYRYGQDSERYLYFYWLSDVGLTLGAFLLICAFFRRACMHEERMWRFLRLLLVFVFLLVVGLSFISLSGNYEQLFTKFIYEFGQYLYFTCLVLNTMLYVLMQQLQRADEELGLLVCGMGVQFAGPTACMALLRLTSAEAYAVSLTNVVAPLCTLAMLLIWFYSIWKPAGEPATVRGRIPVLAEVQVREY